ncbi:hypothetical protein CDCA_CDCA20G4779 [Cyanidium caldarium]|uniref:Protein YIPF n=1 Tax=Cyanidium caldarium TaxID=2771 RepID=A0AAV9J2P0_CYACA|nr:hypothetical protein CDCA_CDCA20G4779 [Cyanidium caldarium]
MTDVAPSEHSTLDESVWESVQRDLRLVCRRAGIVLLPFRCRNGQSVEVADRRARGEQIRTELQDWDLWGPLLVCLLLSTVLSVVSQARASLTFSLVFVVVWLGAALVTVNATLLGGRLSFFQSVCLLGYSVTPLLLAALMCMLWRAVIPNRLAEGIVRFVTVLFWLLWSLFASATFLDDAGMPRGRKALAEYPVVLFFAGIAWTVIMAFE